MPTPAELVSTWRERARSALADRRAHAGIAASTAAVYETCAESLARALGGTPRQMSPTQPPVAIGIAKTDEPAVSARPQTTRPCQTCHTLPAREGSDYCSELCSGEAAYKHGYRVGREERGDDGDAGGELKTTRMSRRFSSQIALMRALIAALRDDQDRGALSECLEQLANDLAQGFPVLVQVPLSASLELPSDVDVSGLVEDTESVFSAARDNRNERE